MTAPSETEEGNRVFISKRLSCFLVFVAFCGALIGSVLISVSLYLEMKKGLETVALQNAYTVSETIFNSLYQLMRKGVKSSELLEIIRIFESLNQNNQVKIYLFTPQSIRNGHLRGRPEVKKAFTQGKEWRELEESRLFLVKPIVAKYECIACHTEARSGDILGVIQIEYNLESEFSYIKRKILVILGLLFIFPLLVAALISYVIRTKIGKKIEGLHHELARIRKVSDLSELNIERIDFSFQEFNSIRDEVAYFVDRVRKIAIDKDILEFQMKFLENFIITSEAVIDWEYIVINALDGISDKICFTFFFVVFREEGEDFYAYIFWNTRVHGDCQRKVEELIEKHLRQSGAWEEEAGITYIHREVETKRSPEKRPVEDLEAYTRVLVLEKPLIGGALGLGMNLLDVQSEVKGLAVQSVLPTLLNIVGSAKAIHKYTKELEYYATRDPLTELYNQRVLWELLDYEVERARRHNYKFAFLIVDIDNFKLINDAYGHEFGDQMLKGIAGILRDMFRKEDLVARYGGDEFAMVLPYAGEEQAYSVALRLLKNIEEFSLISPEGQKVKATASIGIAVFPDHARDAKQLFLIADNMLYKAKREGKNKVALPSPEDLSLIAEEVLKKSSILSTAVEEKRVLPYFQPIVDVHTLEARAYEVLMRIEQPDGRILPAREFIHIAETSGLLQRMDLTLLENAARRISAEATEAEFFFNLSPKSLVLPSFIEEVRYILRKYNVPPHRIVFELTERETVKNLKILKDFVRNLKKDGFKFAVDDFGSGFSSFTYIKHFPIDYLKIEGDFIRSMARNKVDLALVQSAVTLARTLNIKTIAEFVEDEEIFGKVREVGIDLAQGYYLGKPRREIGGP